MRIKKTKDYEQFKFFDENRDVKTNKVNRLVDSILRTNKLKVNPIIVNKANYIVDGQHRLKAAEELGESIYYIVDDDAKLDDVIPIQTQYAWTMVDYLSYWIQKGKKDYELLDRFVKSYGLSLSVSMYLLAGAGPNQRKNGDKPGSLIGYFKEGRYKVTSYGRGAELAERLFAIREYCLDSCWRSRSFISALMKAYEVISHKKLLHRLKTSGKELKRQVNTVEYLRQFEDVVNYRARKRTRLY